MGRTLSLKREGIYAGTYRISALGGTLSAGHGRLIHRFGCRAILFLLFTVCVLTHIVHRTDSFNLAVSFDLLGCTDFFHLRFILLVHFSFLLFDECISYVT